MPHNATLAHDLRAVCMRITRRVRHEATSLPPHLFSVLAALDAGPLTATHLAEREKVSAPSMSRTLKELTDRGYLTREVDSDDRRARILHLTKAGRQVLAEGRRTRDQWMVEHVRDCTPEEQLVLQQATVILDRMLAADC